MGLEEPRLVPNTLEFFLGDLLRESRWQHPTIDLDVSVLEHKAEHLNRHETLLRARGLGVPGHICKKKHASLCNY